MSASADLAPDLALPSLDVRALARRAALPAGLLAVAVTLVVAAGGPLQAFADALARALDADPRWVAAAAVFELASFGGYIALLWLVGRRATRRLDLRASAQVTLGGAAATRLLPTGGAGGAAMTLWALRRAGLGARGAARTLLTFLVLLYAVFFGSIAVAGGALALGLVDGYSGPVALTAVPAAGATLAIAIALGLAYAARRGIGVEPARSRARAGRRASTPSCAAPPASSGRRSATRSGSCARPIRACSARWPGGASTRPCCGRCSTRSAARRRWPSWCSPTSSGRSPTRSRSRAPRAAGWSACCWPSASTPSSRSAPCSPTAPWRSGSPPRSAWWP